MRVTFTCEKCGRVCYEGDYVPHEKVERWVDECPVCAKLTYGPLTEEMVAEALCLASGGDTGVEFLNDYIEEARFVLRLLERMYPYHEDASYVPSNRFHEMDWHEWLLKIAREP